MKTTKIAQTILTIGISKGTTLTCIIWTFIMLTYSLYISLVRLMLFLDFNLQKRITEVFARNHVLLKIESIMNQVLLIACLT